MVGQFPHIAGWVSGRAREGSRVLCSVAQVLFPMSGETGVPGPGRPERRWFALGVIAAAQLMTALDATIVNIALPSAQRTLGFDDAQRQWVVTAYTVCFAGLLLLGGRVADVLGRRRALQIGLTGFGLASLLAGLAPGLPVLAAGRALQA